MGSSAPAPASQDRSENEADKVRSALVLCYGHVAARAPRELVQPRVESDIFRNMSQCFSTKVGAGRCLRGGPEGGAAARAPSSS